MTHKQRQRVAKPDDDAANTDGGTLARRALDTAPYKPHKDRDTSAADARAKAAYDATAVAQNEIGANGQACLELIAAIRLTAPEYLEDLLVERRPSESTNQATSEDSAPASIGRFRVLRPIGRGGHGVVFLAEDPALNRQVALKVPRPEALLTEPLRRRFLREAEAAAALDHRNIVPVYEAGNAGPVHYIAAAYCDGDSLSEWLEKRGGHADPRQAAQILSILADGVQHAHSRGVLHRDIKPANVLIDGAGPDVDDFEKTIRLTDFGLARVGTAPSADSVSSELLGTPYYMAPEQAAGQQDDVTTATDVYGLGATLYQMLTGCPPLRRETQADTLWAVQYEDVVPPRTRRTDVPPDLEAICLKCLAKLPNERYGTAAELRDDLQRYLQGQAVVARPLGRLRKWARWCQRRPALTAMAALVLVSVFAGTVNVLWQWRRAERHLAESQRQERRALEYRDEAQRAVDELLTEVAQGLKDVPQVQTLRRNLLLKAAQMNERLLQSAERDPGGSLQSVRAWRRAADIFAELGDGERQAEAIERGLELAVRPLQTNKSVILAENEFSSVAIERGLLVRQRGELRSTRQEHELALQDYAEAMAIFKRPMPVTKSTRFAAEAAETERLIGAVWHAKGSYDQATSHFEAAVSTLEKPATELTPSESLEYVRLRVDARQSLGEHYQRIGRPNDALQCFQASRHDISLLINAQPLAIRFQQHEAELDVSTGFLLISMDRHEEAAQPLNDATAAFRQLVIDFPLSPRAKIWLARSLTGQAAVLHRLDRLEESETIRAEAAQLLTEAAARHDRPETRRQIVRAFGELAKIRRLCKDWQGAEEAANLALSAAAKLAADSASSYLDKKVLCQALFDVACYKMGKKDYAACIDFCEQAISQRKELLSSNPRDTDNRRQLAKTTGILASAQGTLRDYDLASRTMVEMGKAAPDWWFACGMEAIGWLELAARIEEFGDEAKVAPKITIAECQQRAITSLNHAVELEGFDVRGLLRMESFREFAKQPHVREQLALEYQVAMAGSEN